MTNRLDVRFRGAIPEPFWKSGAESNGYRYLVGAARGLLPISVVPLEQDANAVDGQVPW